MDWEEVIQDFKAYMLMERKLSAHTLDAYLQDVDKLVLMYPSTKPSHITSDQVENLLQEIANLGLSAHTQSRILSGIKLFFKYLRIENIIIEDPTQGISNPKLSRKIPEVLSITEIEKMLESIDLSKPQGHRNHAIIETLYSTGLRVTELVNLKISHLYLDVKLIQVIGKNNKERLIPIGSHALKSIDLYLSHRRAHNLPTKKSLKRNPDEDILFLNRRGKRLTRVMIYTIVKNIAEQAGIEKKVSPHTFRHSFATHLVEGGADLRAIQDLLGHESITTTEIYSHIDREYIRNTMMLYHPRAKN